ncbi:hypothetical protein MTX78_24920 (plasmid) [Hymenobacter tibetensis]|uniref:Alpha/beta hydrolase n=1 Tax=Hymenobacter tibetensis TaxID=497967 RepID=A0ABY4D7W4_9BACT|nr:hypothetical protein [Hymenobacter tibetensis]UOG77655.1 hypothetical protein MTX78_24920 [Hymenobacter tibetensis]
MKLVLIHGRGQAGLDPQLLQQQWLTALHHGCARARVQLPADTVVEFPYYGDALAQAVAEIDSPLDAAIRAKGLLAGPDVALAGEILLELAAHAGIHESDIVLEVGSVPVERGPANWGWVQALLRAVDRLPGLNSQLLTAFTRDVSVYLSYDGVRARVNDIVAATLSTTEPCVVLAHSLGTVVAYDILRERGASPQYPGLVTVGSPLGIRAIQRQLATPLVSPPGVAHWFNAYDNHDVVALLPLDARYFNVTPAIENKSDVLNHTEDRHGIMGYLTDPVVARRIVEALEGRHPA